ncbi:MAG: adenylate/guanylate cyclase domain-containing protein [Deltaproteobacteria bacterium]|nr:adenylate/guanylate cyclase domain-containing protein [Deltaproteobacteria bacterium]
MSRFRWLPALVALVGGLLIAGLGSWRLFAYRNKTAHSMAQAVAQRHRILATILAQLQTPDAKNSAAVRAAMTTFTQPSSPLLYALLTDATGRPQRIWVNRHRMAKHLSKTLPATTTAMAPMLQRLGATRDLDRFSARLPNGGRLKTSFVKPARPGLSWWWLALAAGLILAFAAEVGVLRPPENPDTWIALERAIQERQTNQPAAQTLRDTIQQAASLLHSDAKVIAQFKHHLPDQILSKLLAGASLGADERAVTTITIRLDDISSLYDSLAMNQVIDLVNTYLDVVVETMHKHHAVLGSVGPDGVKAWWGAPDDIVDSEIVACQAALELRRAVFEVNRVQQATTQQVLHVHVGLATGRAVLAKVGSARRMTYSLIGMSSHRADALSSVAENDEILICDQTARFAEDHGFRLECLSSPRTGPASGRVHKLLAAS